MSSKQVEVGGDSFPIQRFRGLKAIMAMAAITRIAREIPDIMADAVKAFQDRNTITVKEEMTIMPRWSSFTTEDFDRAEEKTGVREINIPIPMTQNEQVLYALPKLLENGRKEVVRLFALLIIPNTELMEADKADKVEEALDRYYDRLMYEAELDQLVDLALTAQDVLSEQLSDRKDRLGNLVKSLGLTKIFRLNQTPPQALPTSPEPITEAVSTTPTSTQDAPTSSIDSDEPMDGTEQPRSMASLGASS